LILFNRFNLGTWGTELPLSSDECPPRSEGRRRGGAALRRCCVLARCSRATGTLRCSLPTHSPRHLQRMAELVPATQPEPEPAHPEPESEPRRPVLTSWTHAGSCTDPACTDPTCADAQASVSVAASSLGTATQPAVCRHWWRKGSCLYGDSCKFGHPPRETLPPWPRRAYRQQTYNAGRVGIFRRWIVDTFGLELLQSGGVLDVSCSIHPLLWSRPQPHRIVEVLADCLNGLTG
jgi:hypothetical protein